MAVKRTKRGKARGATKRKTRNTRWEDELMAQIAERELSEPQREFRFHPKRRWRSDFAWPEQRLLVEVDGGIYMRGRHVTPKGFIADAEKRNNAMLMGYRVLHFVPETIKSGEAIRMIEQALERD